MKPKKNNAPLPGDEWNWQNCPDRQLPYCLEYELFREPEAEPVRIEVAALRRRFRCRDRAALVECFQPGETALVGWAARLLLLFPEWPATPWLGIPEETRDKRLAHITGEELPPDIAACWFHLRDEGDHGELADKVKLHNGDGGETVFVHRVNWAQSNTKLAGEFRRWLEKNRPRTKTKKQSFKRGRTSERDLLKALGARRILKHGNCNSAPELAPGKTLYFQESAWYRAKGAADRLLRETLLSAFEWPLRPEVADALAKALAVSVAELPQLPGRPQAH